MHGIETIKVLEEYFMKKITIITSLLLEKVFYSLIAWLFIFLLRPLDQRFNKLCNQKA